MQHSKFEAIAILAIITFFILAMVTFIIVILFFAQKKQKGFNQELMDLRANFDRELFKAQLETQEQTFKEIAQEIHDNVGQLLSMAILGLGTLDFEQKDEAKESVLETSDILVQALEDLRHMSRSMNSEIIKNGGLQKSIEMQMGFLKRGGKFITNFEVCGEQVKMDETKEIILFRILQEAVSNIIKHAKAKEISISLLYQRDFLLLKIQDNGKGFCLKDKISGVNQINGLRNMQHRSKLIEAKFELTSEIDNGTLISVITPY